MHKLIVCYCGFIHFLEFCQEISSEQDKLDKDLWYACMDGDIARVKKLIRQGAALNCKEVSV